MLSIGLKDWKYVTVNPSAASDATPISRVTMGAPLKSVIEAS